MSFGKIESECLELQKATDIRIRIDQCFVMRLDGKNFSTLTKKFIKPFDSEMTKAMQLTTMDLILNFHCVTGYCQSDEISLLFPFLDQEKNQTHLFSGRVQKLCSIVASRASVMFNNLLSVQKKCELPVLPVFDARVIACDTKEQTFECFDWRVKDCKRNAIMAIAQSHFSHKLLHGLDCKQVTQKLQEKGINVSDYPDANTLGTWFKKYKKLQTNEYGTFERSTIEQVHETLDTFTLFAKNGDSIKFNLLYCYTEKD